MWSRNYYKIIARYEHTITGQFFGHTHFDEFEVFYDPADLCKSKITIHFNYSKVDLFAYLVNLARAVSVAYVGPSVSPYYDLNPGYRIYYVDGDHDDTTRVSLLLLLNFDVYNSTKISGFN